MYIRFVNSQIVRGMSAREGFFGAAYDLREADGLDEYSLSQLEDLLAYFRQNLPIPDRFHRSKSKRQFREDTRGLCWFKPDAKEAIRKAYELSSLLEQHGYVIEKIYSDRIGYIVFEDHNQVVADPFADTPT